MIHLLPSQIKLCFFFLHDIFSLRYNKWYLLSIDLTKQDIYYVEQSYNTTSLCVSNIGNYNSTSKLWNICLHLWESRFQNLQLISFRELIKIDGDELACCGVMIILTLPKLWWRNLFYKSDVSFSLISASSHLSFRIFGKNQLAF